MSSFDHVEAKDVIRLLQRALSKFEKDPEAGGASVQQLMDVSNLEQALEVMVKASAISAEDAQLLLSFKSKSGGTADTLNGLLGVCLEQVHQAELAEAAAQLEDGRQAAGCSESGLEQLD